MKKIGKQNKIKSKSYKSLYKGGKRLINYTYFSEKRHLDIIYCINLAIKL